MSNPTIRFRGKVYERQGARAHGTLAADEVRRVRLRGYCAITRYNPKNGLWEIFTRLSAKQRRGK